MAGIFISYRRDDAQGEARHLFDNLGQHFGADRVFMDVIAIRPGEDYRKVIESAVASCDVLITLIGKEWLESAAPGGQPRLRDARDFVRLETAAALKRDVRVIPVLVQGAAMPTEEALPDELKPLAFRNAIELSHSRWDYDVRMLIEALERVVTPVAAGSVAASAGAADRSTPSTPPPPSRERRPAWHMAVIGAVVAAVLGGGYWLWRELRSPELSKTTITVADFAGQAEEAAVKAVRDLGLEPTVKRAVTESSRAGTVIAQHPSKGAKLARGDAVELTVGAAATGAVPATVEVPQLLGVPRVQAAERLKQVGLNVTWETVRTRAVPGTVVKVYPEPGARARVGTAVLLTVSISVDEGAPDRCLPGYVWREAFPRDHVCVEPKIRDEAYQDNKEARRRLEPDPSKRAYGPDTCAQGYVWRQASLTDHVCVKPNARARAAEDNRAAESRVAQ